LARAPNDVDVLTARATAYQALEDFKAAETDLSAALAQQPKSQALLLQRAKLRFIANRFADAVSDFKTADAVPGTVSNAAPQNALWLFMAQDRIKQNGRDKLVATANMLTSRAWPSALFRFFLGEVSAETVMGQAGDDKSRACEAHFYLGHAGVMLGQADQARGQFALALSTCAPGSLERLSAKIESAKLP
ncbi:MAG: hypothetical protein JNM81_16060, partial [Rhodospirillaceae bacterium]|nr:hypothetical protein [Rhodospirillaceae bacterium]